MFFWLIGAMITAGLAVFFYRAAEHEGLRFPTLWALGSVGLLLGPLSFTEFGLLVVLGLQLVLFIGMCVTIYFTKWR